MRRSPALAALLLASSLLVGCSADDEPDRPSPTSPDAPVLQPGRPGEPNSSLTGTAAAPTSSSTHNSADVTFLQDMIVHHAQAVVMGDIVKGRLTDDEVRRIADRISDEQRPEMDGMAETLRSWGEKVPPQAKNPKFGMRGHGAHAHAGMPGMASEEDLVKLTEASGPEVDRLYLDLMTAHHDGALAMADTVRERGRDERVGELADDITVTQQKQIDQMKGMRSRL